MDVFNIYLPVAGIEFNVLLLITIGFCVGVIGGFFGIGGGWLVVPALNIFGFHMAYAIGTSLARLFGQSLGAIKKHQKMGNVDWKLGCFSSIPSIIGFEVGSNVVIDLEKIGTAGTIIRWCYVVFLAGLGSFMLYDYFVLSAKLLKNKEEKISTAVESTKSVAAPTGIAEKLRNINIPPMISFPKSKIETVSIWIVIIIFLFTGFLSGILGIGGGFIILPALVYLVGLPTIIAVGTCLFTVLVTSAVGCFTYAVEGGVEIIAAILMLVGASIGAQIGATAIKFIKGYSIRLLFAIMVIFICFSVVIEQFYRLVLKPFLKDMSGIILLGTALTMTIVIIAKLIIEFRKEKSDKISVVQ